MQAAGNRIEAKLIQPVTNEVVVSDVDPYTKEYEQEEYVTDNKNERIFELSQASYAQETQPPPTSTVQQVEDHGSFHSSPEEENSARYIHSHHNSLQSV